MKRIINIITPLFLSLLLSGCMGGSPKPDASTNSLPSWYLNTSADSPFYYYGVGSGASKSEAINEALNQIAGKISVVVESTFKSKQKSSMNNGKSSFSNEVDQSIKAKIQGIKFSNYKVSKNAQIGKKIYLLVKVDREALFKSKLKELNAIDVNIDSEWKRSENLTNFEKIKLSSAIQKDIINAKAMFPILTAIKNDFLDASYNSKYNDYNSKFSKLKDNIYAYIKKGNSPKFESIVRKYLSQYGIKLVDKLSSSTKSLIIIEVKKESKQLPFKLKNNKFVKVTVQINTYSSKNKLLAKNSVSVKNVSKISVKDASNKTEKFEKLIISQGIIKVLTGK
jgi:hypothetical protein